MKKLFPIFFGFLIPFLIFSYVYLKLDPGIGGRISTLGTKVGLGDPNIQDVNYSAEIVSGIGEITEGKKGLFSIFIKNLNTGQTINYGGENTFYPASLYKIPVAIIVLEEIEKEQLTFEQKLEFKHANYFSGSGTLKAERVGSQFSVEELLKRLIKDSDNVAQSILLSRADKADIYEFLPNPLELRTSQMASILERLYLGEYLSAENTSKLLSLMRKTSFDNRVHLGLVKGISFSHKIGNWARTGSWHDCGIILEIPDPLIVCVMSKNTTYKDFLSVTEEVGAFVSRELIDLNTGFQE